MSLDGYLSGVKDELLLGIADCLHQLIQELQAAKVINHIDTHAVGYKGDPLQHLAQMIYDYELAVDPEFMLNLRRKEEVK